ELCSCSKPRQSRDGNPGLWAAAASGPIRRATLRVAARGNHQVMRGTQECSARVAADHRPIVFDMKNAEDIFPLSPRGTNGERVGEKEQRGGESVRFMALVARRDTFSTFGVAAAQKPAGTPDTSTTPRGPRTE